MAMENPPFKNLVRWFSHLEASIYIYIYIVWHSLGISQLAMFDDTMMRKSIDIQWSCHVYPVFIAWLRTFLKTSISRNTSYQLHRNPSTYQPGVAAAAGIHLRWFKDLSGCWLKLRIPATHTEKYHKSICKYRCVYCMYVNLYVLWHTCTHTCIYIYIILNMYIHTHTHIYIYIYIYVRIIIYYANYIYIYVWPY